MLKTSTTLQVKSPCIGVCSTGIGDAVCRGCKRYSHEIIHWNAYTEPQRVAIQNRLQSLLSQVVSAKVRIVDEARLKQQIAHQKVRHSVNARPHVLVFDLLKAGASQISDLGDFGLQLLPGYEGYSAVALRDVIDQDFYILSSVHYERYFQFSQPHSSEHQPAQQQSSQQSPKHQSPKQQSSQQQ